MAKPALNKFNSISKGWNFLFSVIGCLLSLLMIVPMVLVFIVSFSPEISIAERGFSFTPMYFTTEGYGYLMKMGDQILEYPPARIEDWELCDPIYETVPGWKQDISK